MSFSRGSIRRTFIALSLFAFLKPSLARAQDIQVNQADVNLGTLDNSTTQSETSHAIFGSIVVVGFNDTREYATTGLFDLTSITGYAYSTNGGRTFVDASPLAPPTGMVSLGDPALAVDNAGNFYLAALAVSNVYTRAGSRVSVYRSTATSPAVTFGTPVLVSGLYTTGAPYQDKELIAVDRSGGTFNGRVYVAWSELTSTSSSTARVLVTSSTTTNPLAFATPIALTTDGAINHGAMPAVGPDGEVFVVWGVFGSATTPIQCMKSTNGGATFTNPDPADPAAAKTIATVAASPELLGTGGIFIRTRGFPYVAVDRTPVGSPSRGYVYVVFQADPDGTGGDNADIFFSRSTDGGATWSTPRSITSGPAVTIGRDNTTHDNWQPSISASLVNGHITVTFQDRRGDAANTQITLYKALSTDGGLTWSNAQVSSTAFTPSTGYNPLPAATYMGDYNWCSAEGSEFQFSWGDCRNTCSPPADATSPCSPSARGDQDAFFASAALLTRPDLFITPWGDVTGIPPQWQTPDIFVVDASGAHMNASKGVVNLLRARVTNLGTAAAGGVVIRFKYAPWFAGISDAVLKEIGTVTASFPPAGDASGEDIQEIPMNWDLTDLTDTNGGLWPMPISAFQHFCVKASIEFATDINTSNNYAQNNFFDVATSGGGTPIRFLLGNPLSHTARARLIAPRVPKGYRIKLTKAAARIGAYFSLNPREIRVVEAAIIGPISSVRPTSDQILDLNLEINKRTVGGISIRVARAKEGASPAKGADRGVERPYAASYDSAFSAILAVMRKMREPVVLADRGRGLVNSGSIAVANARLREITTDDAGKHLGSRSGRYLISFKVHRTSSRITRVLATTLILVTSEERTPLGGTPVPSKGVLERSHLDAIEAWLRGVR